MNILILIFFAFNSWAQEEATPTYSIQTAENSPVYGCYNSCTNSLVVETPSSTGTDSAAVVYVPMYDQYLNLGYDPDNATSTISSNLEYSLFTQVDPNTSSAVNTIPSYTQEISNTSAVNHLFSINNTYSSNMYVYAAIVNPSNREEIRLIGNNTTSIIGNFGSVARNSSGNYWVSLPIYDLCTTALNSFYPNLCAGLKALDPTDTAPHYPDVNIYFFLSNCKTIPDPNSTDANCKNPPAPTSKNYSGGIYFKYFLGNVVNPSPPSIDSLAKGDERVKVNFSGDGTFYLNDIIALKYPDISSGTEQTFFQALLDGGVVASSGNGPQNSGYFVVKNLANNQTIKIGIAYVNKFKFSTLVSDSEEQTPQPIVTFIQEKECYLLSAGFQREHYIIDYFRFVRDQYLLKNSLGRVFVKWYYRTAPDYAPLIYKNLPLRTIVQLLAYLAYVLFRFFPILMAMILIYFLVRKPLVKN